MGSVGVGLLLLLLLQLRAASALHGTLPSSLLTPLSFFATVARGLALLILHSGANLSSLLHRRSNMLRSSFHGLGYCLKSRCDAVVSTVRAYWGVMFFFCSGSAVGCGIQLCIVVVEGIYSETWPLRQCPW
jgi:hypothetical protein